MIPNINLLPELEKKKTSSKLLYTLLIAVVVISLAYLIYEFYTAENNLTVLAEKESKLTSQRDELQKDLNVQKGENQVSLEQAVQYIQGVAYPVTLLIDETRALLPANSYLRGYVFGTDTINISVDFESMKDISKYIERLLVSNYFTDIQIGSIKNFEVKFGEPQDLTPAEYFKHMPRYAVTITAMIDYKYLGKEVGAH